MADLNVTARKKSEDPVQEALRQHKDKWNHETSLLIAQLIAFKKGLNGRGESKVGIPPGSIKDPMPHEVGSYLDQLSDRYNKLISDAHSIIEEQNRYSETRKKSVKEQTASFDEDILKIASWWGSRALTYSKNWFASDKEVSKIKMTMLKSSVDLVEQLKTIDTDIVSKEINSIPSAIYKFDRFLSTFNKLINTNIKKLNALNEKLNDSRKKDTEIITPSESIEENSPQKDVEQSPVGSEVLELSGTKNNDEVIAKKILEDIIVVGRLAQLMNLRNFKKEDINSFDLGIKELRKLLDNIIIAGNGSIDTAIDFYNDLKKISSKLFKIKTVNFIEQLEIVEADLLKNATNVSIELEKLAKNWLNRQKLKIFPSSDDRIKLEASYKILALIKSFNGFQDALEKNELNSIINEFEILKNNIIEIASDLFFLGKINNDKYEEDRLLGKPKTHIIKQEILNRLKNMKDQF